MSDLSELYQEVILDHNKRPRNYGTLADANRVARGHNPLCGDKLHLFLEIGDDGIVRDASFEGSGCAISLASASLLTETIIGLDRGDALARRSAMTHALRGETCPDNLGKLQALLGVREFPARVKCATLAWHALAGALERRTAPVSTEN